MVLAAATLVVVGTTLLAARPGHAHGDAGRRMAPARDLPDPLGALVELEPAPAAADRPTARELELSLDGNVKRYEPAS
jgi:hypothetical protein